MTPPHAYARDLPSRFCIYNYPKTFMWRGWHPRRMCSISPILMDRKSEEWKKLRAMSDEDYKKYQSLNLVKNVPDKIKQWCDTNKDKLNVAREKGKLPYTPNSDKIQVANLTVFKDNYIEDYLELQYHGNLTIDYVDSLTVPYDLKDPNNLRF